MTTNGDGSYGHATIAAFLGDMPADVNLRRHVAEAEELAAIVTTIPARRAALTERLAEIDIALVGAPDNRKRLLLMERATTAAEINSLAGQRKEATRRQVTAVLSALRMVGQMAAAALPELQREHAEVEADVRLQLQTGTIEEILSKRAAIAAKRDAIAVQIARARAIPKAIDEAAGNLFPNGDVKPNDERTWVNAYRHAEWVADIEDKRLRPAA